MATVGNVQNELSLTIADQMLFYHICELFENIRNMKGRNKKNRQRACLSRYISRWRPSGNSTISSSSESFFPAMRLILPAYDRTRQAYGFKQVNVGDFAEVAYGIVKQRLPDREPGPNPSLDEWLTIAELNRKLDALALAHTERTKERQRTIFAELVRRATPREHRWLVCVLLKDVRCGLNVKSVLDTFHPDAEGLYSVTQSLEKVCMELHDPTKRIHELVISLGTAFQPMLAAPCDLQTLEEQMQHKEFFIETKFDGERVQIHRNGDTYTYFSRNGFEVSHVYGRTPAAGTLTPALHQLFKAHVQSCILDGEMLLYDRDSDSYITKGDNANMRRHPTSEARRLPRIKRAAAAATKGGQGSMDEEGDEEAGDDEDDAGTGTLVSSPDRGGSSGRTMGEDDNEPIDEEEGLLHAAASAGAPGSGAQHCFVVFDLLLLNGQVLTNRPLQERRALLEQAFTPQRGRLEISRATRARRRLDVINALNAAIEAHDEGVVIKQCESVYACAHRLKVGGWLKLKPDYVASLQDDLDLLVVGGYYGEGYRSGILSHFLLALREDSDETARASPRFVAFCKVGTGYSLLELQKINRRLAEHCRPFDRQNPPNWLRLSTEKPEVIIEPEKSVLVQIHAAEFQETRDFPLGTTLRFPRLVCFRTDRQPLDAMTVSHFEQFKQSSGGKLASKFLTERAVDDLGIGGGGTLYSKRKRAAPDGGEAPSASAARRGAHRATVASQFQGAPLPPLSSVTGASAAAPQLFAGLTFHVSAAITSGDEEEGADGEEADSWQDLLGKEELNKKTLEQLIHAHGGQRVQNPEAGKTFAVIADSKNARVKNLIAANKYDVARSSWLLRSIRAQQILPFAPADLLAASPATAKLLESNFDEFGDSYTEPVTSVNELRKLIERVNMRSSVTEQQESANIELSESERMEVAELEAEMFDSPPLNGLLRTLGLYVARAEDITGHELAGFEREQMELERRQLERFVRLLGGQVHTTLSNDTSHVLVPTLLVSRLSKENWGVLSIVKRPANSVITQRRHVLQAEWLHECFHNRKLITELGFEIRL